MDLKVNAAEWNALGAPEKAKVESIIKGFFKEARLVPDSATAAASAAQPESLLGGIGGAICKAACTLAETAAVAACASLPPPLNAICVLAAHKGGDECRKHC